MKIIEVKENQKEEWNDFVKTSSNSSLLQSFEWGEFQKSLGRKIWRLAVIDKRWLAVALVIKHHLSLGKSYLYCPRGPVFGKSKIKNQNAKLQTKIQKFENLKLLFEKIEKIAKRENSVFLRIDPAIQSIANSQQLTAIKELGLKKTSREVQPKDTLILDTTGSEDELLAQMHQKTRYNIRLAERKGVKIRQSVDFKDIDVFWELLCETTERERFKSHPKRYYKKQIEVLSQGGLIKLFLARYKGKIVAANIVSFFGDMAVYLHGASLYEYRKVMAPYLLQWKAISEAKRRECKYYDFWGVAPKDLFNHPWAGITRFKKGFGGKEVHYIGAWDLVYQPVWYKLYNLAKGIITR